MTLLYLYVEKYGILKKAEFNFSDKYRFHYDPEVQELTSQVKNDTPLPANFFSVNKSHSVVDCISALIGGNGAGKTSVARALSEILASDTVNKPAFEFIVIFLKECGSGNAFPYIRSRVLKNNISKKAFDDNRVKYCPPPGREYSVSFLEKVYNFSRGTNCILKRDSDYLYPFIRNSDTSLFECDIALSTDLLPPNNYSHISDYSHSIPINPGLIYLTNFYTPFYQSYFDNEPSSDLSTSCLMQKARETFTAINPSLPKLRYRRDTVKQKSTFGEETAVTITDWGSYDIVELIQMVHFFSAYYCISKNATRKNDLKLPHPKSILIGVLPLKTKRAREVLCDFSKSKRWKDYSDNFVDFLEYAATHSMSTALRIFSLFALEWLSTPTAGVAAHRQKHLSRFIIYCVRRIDFIKEITFDRSKEPDIQRYLTSEIRRKPLFANLFQRIDIKVPSDDNNTKEPPLTASLPPDVHFEEAISLYDFLLPFKDIWTFSLGNEYVPLNNSKSVNFIADFIARYFRTCSGIGYLSFKWNPDLSAGEYAQFSLYSRLFSFLSKDNQASLSSQQQSVAQYLIFFDEIEITIHPDLQRNLVENVIKFLELFFGAWGNVHFTFHVIFASHSPILLSDIPRSNVMFLRSRNAGTNHLSATTLTDNEIASKSTFGANIHALYKDSFFLEDSLVGSFALTKIKQIVTALKKGFCSPELFNLIKVIDEPLIRTSLENDFFTNLRKNKPSMEEQMLRARLNELRIKKGH